MLKTVLFVVAVQTAFTCKLYSDTTLFSYLMTNGRGQVLLDRSGNDCHAVSGETLETEDSDVTWTDRGAFFDGADKLLVGNNAISQCNVNLESSVVFSTWVNALVLPGLLGGRGTSMSTCIRETGVFLHVMGSNKVLTENEDDVIGRNYVGRWTLVTVFFIPGPSDTTVAAYFNEISVGTATMPVVYEASETDSDFLIGYKSRHLEGFMYSFAVYADIGDPITHADFIFLNNDQPACEVYPVTEAECLSVEPSPTSNSSGIACACGADSCDETGACLVCHSSCPEACVGPTEEECLELPRVCYPYVYEPELYGCDWDIICGWACYYCQAQDQCLVCYDNYFLDSWSQCVGECPTGEFGNPTTQMCEPCHLDCATCSDGTTCDSCQDLNAEPVGLCLCKPGYYVLSDSPLVCQECGFGCLACDDVECRECEEPLELRVGTCVSVFDFTVEMGDDKVFFITASKDFDDLTEEDFEASLSSDQDLLLNCTKLNNTSFAVYYVLSSSVESDTYLVLDFVDTLRSSDGSWINATHFELLLPATSEQDASWTSDVEGILDTYFIGLATALAVALIGMVMLNNPRMLWTVGCNAQILFYLLVLDISYSASFTVFLQSYVSVLYMPNLILDHIHTSENAPPGHFDRLALLEGEYDDANFLRNSGRVLLIFLCIFVILTIVLWLATLLSKSPLNSVMNKLKSMSFSATLCISFQLYLDLLVPAALEVTTTDQFNESTTFACLYVAVSAIVFAYMLIAGCRRSHQQANPGQATLSLLFFGIQGTKKLWYGFALACLYSEPLLILGSLVGFSLISFVLSCRTDVFEDRRDAAIWAFSELSMLVSLVSISLMPSWGLEVVAMSAQLVFILLASAGYVIVFVSKCVRRRRSRQIRVNYIENCDQSHFSIDMRFMWASPSAMNDDNANNHQ